MKITKELIENMVREALSEAAEPAPEPAPAADMASDDVARILTKQDMERINTKPEYIRALNMILKHAVKIPQGKAILLKVHREDLPAIIKKMR